MLAKSGVYTSEEATYAYANRVRMATDVGHVRSRRDFFPVHLTPTTTMAKSSSGGGGGGGGGGDGGGGDGACDGFECPVFESRCGAVSGVGFSAIRPCGHVVSDKVRQRRARARGGVGFNPRTNPPTHPRVNVGFLFQFLRSIHFFTFKVAFNELSTFNLGVNATLPRGYPRGNRRRHGSGTRGVCVTVKTSTDKTTTGSRTSTGTASRRRGTAAAATATAVVSGVRGPLRPRALPPRARRGRTAGGAEGGDGGEASERGRRQGCQSRGQEAEEGTEMIWWEEGRGVARREERHRIGCDSYVASSGHFCKLLRFLFADILVPYE